MQLNVFCNQLFGGGIFLTRFFLNELVFIYFWKEVKEKF
jgi:hypothetical protein